MALTTTTDVVTLRGMEELQRALRDNAEAVRALVGQAVAVTTFAIAQGVRAGVPRASGLLAANISSRASGLSGAVEIGVDAFYWHFLEFGTVKLGARPFIRTAAEAESPVFERRLQDIAGRLERRFDSMARAA